MNDPEGTKHFVLDFTTRTVSRDAPRDRDIIFDVPALVLNDLAEKRMFSAWTPSKRLSIHVPGDSLAPVWAFLTLIDYYETGYLPLRGLLSRNFLGFALRRARELAAISEAGVRYLHAKHVAHVPLKPKAFFRPDRFYFPTTPR